MTTSQVAQARELLAAGASYRETARHIGVSQTTIRNLARRDPPEGWTPGGKAGRPKGEYVVRTAEGQEAFRGTVTECANWLGIKPKSVYSLCSEGRGSRSGHRVERM